MPDVWCTAPFDLKLRNGFSFSTGHQMEGAEQLQQESKKGKSYGNISPLPIPVPSPT